MLVFPFISYDCRGWTRKAEMGEPTCRVWFLFNRYAYESFGKLSFALLALVVCWGILGFYFLFLSLILVTIFLERSCERYQGYWRAKSRGNLFVSFSWVVFCLLLFYIFVRCLYYRMFAASIARRAWMSGSLSVLLLWLLVLVFCHVPSWVQK